MVDQSKFLSHFSRVLSSKRPEKWLKMWTGAPWGMLQELTLAKFTIIQQATV